MTGYLYVAMAILAIVALGTALVSGLGQGVRRDALALAALGTACIASGVMLSQAGIRDLWEAGLREGLFSGTLYVWGSLPQWAYDGPFLIGFFLWASAAGVLLVQHALERVRDRAAIARTEPRAEELAEDRASLWPSR